MSNDVQVIEGNGASEPHPEPPAEQQIELPVDDAHAEVVAETNR
jgi:hypothetical protein